MIYSVPDVTSDEEIQKGLLAGDFDAQLAFLDRYQDSIVNTLCQRCVWLTSQEIEDIVTEMLYFIIQNPGRIDLTKGNGKMRGYILIASYRKALDMKRLSQSFVERNDRDWDPIKNLRAEFDTKVTGGEAAQSILSQGIRTALHSLINEMSLSNQDIEHLRLRLEKNLSPLEISHHLGITPINERVRWSRLLRNIKRRWSHYPGLLEYGKSLNLIQEERMTS